MWSILYTALITHTFFFAFRSLSSLSLSAVFDVEDAAELALMRAACEGDIWPSRVVENIGEAEAARLCYAVCMRIESVRCIEPDTVLLYVLVDASLQPLYQSCRDSVRDGVVERVRYTVTCQRASCSSPQLPERGRVRVCILYVLPVSVGRSVCLAAASWILRPVQARKAESRRGARGG